MIEHQRQEVDRHLAEREAKIVHQARVRDAEERDPLQEVLSIELQQGAAGLAGGGSSGWEGIDSCRAETLLEEISAVKTHVRAGASTDGSEVRRVAGSSSGKSLKGKKGKNQKAKQTRANKQPSTTVREVHASKEPESQRSGSVLLAWGGGSEGTVEERRSLDSQLRN